MPTLNKQIFVVDTSIAQPHNFQILRGESVEVECRFRNYRDTISLTGMTANAYWRDPDTMTGVEWYSAAATVSNDKVTWTWTDSNDSQAHKYEWYIKVSGSGNVSYRAFGGIEMIGSPASDPTDVPVADSDYYTKEETDSAIAAAIDAAEEHLVPDTREINGHALNADVTLTASDVGAATAAQGAKADRAVLYREDVKTAVDIGTRNPEQSVGILSVAEGNNTTASGNYSHSEGMNSSATGISSHAEGGTTTASGPYSHAEGASTTAYGYYTHAEGNRTTAQGNHSHAEGEGSTAGAYASHAEGWYTRTGNQGEHAEGTYNATHYGNDDSKKTISSIGIGSFQNNKNAVEVMKDGKVFIKGVGNYDGTNPTGQPNAATDLATELNSKAATSALANLVPNTRTVNGKALNQNITLSASDVGAATLSDIPPVDATPTSGSSNPVSSNGVYDELQDVVRYSDNKIGAASIDFGPWGYGGNINFDGGQLHFTHPAIHGTSGVDATLSFPVKTGTVATTADIPAQVNADWEATSGASEILNKPTLAAVATTGSYNDLSNKPTIPAAQVNSDWNASSGVAQILNKPTIPEVVAPTSEATTGQAADAEATWTSISGLGEDITQARIQMALEDGAFALPQTVVELWALTFDTTEIVLLNLSGDVGYPELKAALDEVDEYQGMASRGVRRITFGTNVTNLEIAPNYEYTYEGTSTAVFRLVDDEQTVLEKQEYLYYRFRNCESIELPINLRSFGLDLGGSILNYTYNNGNGLITDYEIKPLLGVFAISGIQSVAPFAFAGWKECKRIVYPHSGAFCPAPHFIDHCTNLEVLDLKDVSAFFMVKKIIKIGNRTKIFYYAPEIANVNPNLKIIVSDDNYTALMDNQGFSTWHPYLVKASDWEYVHHSELADYATSTDVSTAISTATSGLATQTALTTAISGVEAEIPAVSAETWTFTLEDGTTVTKSVAVY